MSTAHPLVEKAKAFAESVDRDDLSGDLQGLLAAFDYRLEIGSDRDVVAHARAVVRWAEREGYELDDADAKPATVKDLRAEIDRRNEGRDEADQIKPTGRKLADLEAALAADDARG